MDAVIRFGIILSLKYSCGYWVDGLVILCRKMKTNRTELATGGSIESLGLNTQWNLPL
jgi:hypothetical protein